MLKGIDLVELSRKITANKELKRDFIAPAGQLEMTVHSDGKTALLVPGQGDFPVLPLAHRQLGTFANIPAQYYDRMKADTPDLLANNVNTWLRRMPADKKRMVRTLGGDNRALLSNSYQRIEHEEIAEVALPILADLPGVQIVSCDVTDKRLYIHFVVPTIQGEVKKGDIVQAGGVIQNSEVGLGSVSVSGFNWRLICLNGMKTADAFRRSHVGRKIEDDAALWADDTKKADDRAILLKVRDIVRAVVDETRFRAQIAKMQNLTEGTITGNIVEAVEVLSNKLGFGEAVRPSILKALAEGGDLSAWGMLNAVTAQAHTAESYDTAVEYETAGGVLLDLPKQEWNSILKAEAA